MVNANYRFLSKTKIAVTASIIMMVASIVGFAMRSDDEVGHLGRVDLDRADAGVATPDRQHDQPVLRVPGDPQGPFPTAGVEHDLTTYRERGHLGHVPL